MDGGTDTGGGAATAADVVRHYETGALYDRILAGLEAAGLDPAKASHDDLRPVDEFHIGGQAATDALLAQVDIAPGDRVIDLGSGLGGTARHVRRTAGARVDGVDLTPEFVDVARRLSEMVGDDSAFHVASATAAPFADATFDAALLLHVGMNIPDKAALFAEAFRLLRPGGVFAVYDIMRLKAEALAYPLPWATTGETSFLAGPEAYRAAAGAAGFRIEAERDQGDFARDFFDRLAMRVRPGAAPPFSIALTMGEAAGEKVANMVANLKARRYAPVEMICRKPDGA